MLNRSGSGLVWRRAVVDDTLELQLLGPVTTDKVGRGYLLQLWHGSATEVNGIRTARMKVAARRGMGWIGDFALKHHTVRARPGVGFWDR